MYHQDQSVQYDSESKYVPPHKRYNTSREFSKNKEDNQGQQRNNYEPKLSQDVMENPRNRRRDFSQGSKFNTRTISQEQENVQKEIEPGPIEIPEMMVPPILPTIVEAKDNLGGSKKNTGLYQHEIDLIGKLAAIRKKHVRQEAQKEFDEWLEHYGIDLEHIYETCVDIKMSYNTFVELAYRCTDTEFNKKKFKYNTL